MLINMHPIPEDSAAMPVHLPPGEAIRRKIADTAAVFGGKSADRYLRLLGPVEPLWPPTRNESPWRLSSYLGAYEDGFVIERAVGEVQRLCPSMRIRRMPVNPDGLRGKGASGWGISLEDGMQDHIFSGREKAIEAVYFRDKDARLLAKLRSRANLDDIAIALGEVLKIDDPELIEKIKSLGITLDTAAGFFFAPLVQVAWAEGKVSKPARDEVLRQAEQRSIERGSTAFLQLEQWLEARPSAAFLEAGIEVLKAGFAVLPAAEREERVDAIVEACRKVAAAGIRGDNGERIGIPALESSIVDGIAHALRS